MGVNQTGKELIGSAFVAYAVNYILTLLELDPTLVGLFTVATFAIVMGIAMKAFN